MCVYGSRTHGEKGDRRSPLQWLGCVGLATLPFAAYNVIRSASDIGLPPAYLEFLAEGSGIPRLEGSALLLAHGRAPLIPRFRPQAFVVCDPLLKQVKHFIFQQPMNRGTF